MFPEEGGREIDTYINQAHIYQAQYKLCFQATKMIFLFAYCGSVNQRL